MTTFIENVEPLLDTRYGIVVFVIPADNTFETIIERAPDDGSGDPDTGNSEDVVRLAAGKKIFVDTSVGAVDDRFHYRARHIKRGYDSGFRTNWHSAKPTKIPSPLPSIPEITNWVQYADARYIAEPHDGEVRWKVLVDFEVGPDVESLHIEFTIESRIISGAGDTTSFPTVSYDINFDEDGEHVLQDSDGNTFYFDRNTDWLSEEGDSAFILDGPIEATPYNSTGGESGIGNPGKTKKKKVETGRATGQVGARVADLSGNIAEGDHVKLAPKIRFKRDTNGRAQLSVDSDPWVEGAVADGSTDDSTALNDAAQRAIDDGIMVVNLSEGATYGISSAFSPNDNVTIRGQGKEATTLKALSDSMTMLNLGNGVTLENVILDGDKANRSNVTGIDWSTNKSRCEMYQVRFKDIPGTAFLMDEVFDGRFYGLNFERCGNSTSPVIDIKSSDVNATANMLFFFGLQIQNDADEFPTHIRLDGRTFGCGFYGLHLEWFLDGNDPYVDGDPDRFGIECSGFRNHFSRVHVAEAEIGFNIKGPRNELHNCTAVNSRDVGLHVHNATAGRVKVFGGAYDGWRVEEGAGIELHGVDSNVAFNCFFNSPDGKIIGGLIEGAAGDEALTVESSADDAVISNVRITGASGEDPVFFGAVSRVILEGCNIEGVGTFDRYVDATAASDCLIHGNLLHGGTASTEDIGSGTNGTQTDNKAV